MTNWRPPLFCLLSLIVPLLIEGARLNMVHRHAFSELTKEKRLREILRSDQIRMMRRKASKTGNGSSGNLPLISAADFSVGQYFVTLKVGSPTQSFMLIADTGSDLIWIKCKYHRFSVRKNIVRRPKSRTGLGYVLRRRRRMFRAYASSSFQAVSCSSDFCKVQLRNMFSLKFCPNRTTPCNFDYRYADGSAALGIFANETVTLDLANGTKKPLRDTVMGCAHLTRGGSSINVADGVLGLGFTPTSFARRAAHRFGSGKLSYCLMDHLSARNVSNFLTFGDVPRPPTLSPMRFTKLLLNVLPPYYAVIVEGIYVGDKMLSIPKKVWSVKAGGGTIIDSGSSLTSLTDLAYRAVMDALKLSLRAFEKVDPGIQELEHCFNSTGFEERIAPRLKIGFSDGVWFEPEVKSYLIDVADGVKCIGIVSTSWPDSCVIGNIMQQNHFWEFDLKKQKLGFASSHCT